MQTGLTCLHPFVFGNVPCLFTFVYSSSYPRSFMSLSKKSNM